MSRVNARLVALGRFWTHRALGPVAVALLALTVWLGLWVTPPDARLHDEVRLLYLHPAIATVALYLAFGLAALCSALYLWPRTRDPRWDLLAASAVEVGVVFLTLTLLTGMLWGRATWGVWWAWDALLTSTLLLDVLFIGYLAIRRVPADPATRARRCAVLALLSSLDVPLVHFSVYWWHTLHQEGTILNPNLSVEVHGSMLETMLLSFLAMGLAFWWLVRQRYLLAVREAAAETSGLDQALVERRAEAVR